MNRAVFFCTSILMVVVSNSKEFLLFIGSLGKLYWRHRRGLPASVQATLRDLLRECGRYLRPVGDLQMTSCKDIRVARGDLSDAMDLLKNLAGGANVGGGAVGGGDNERDICTCRS